MSDASNGGNGHGAGVSSVKVPHLTVTFDLQRFAVTVGGSAPNLEFAKAMLHLALTETDKQIKLRDTRQIVDAAGPMLLPNLRG